MLRITSTQLSRKIQSIPFTQLRNLSTQSPLKRKAKPRLHLADNRINAKKTNNFASLHLHGAIADNRTHPFLITQKLICSVSIKRKESFLPLKLTENFHTSTSNNNVAKSFQNLSRTLRRTFINTKKQNYQLSADCKQPKL